MQASRPVWCNEDAEERDNDADMLTGRRGTFRAARSSWACSASPRTAPVKLTDDTPGRSRNICGDVRGYALTGTPRRGKLQTVAAPTRRAFS